LRGVDGSLSDVVFIFEVHQPYRIKQSFFWDQQVFKRLSKGELFDHYFDTALDREIFMRISRKCYLPTNEIILKAIDESKFEKKRVKISFSLSGIFLEQCEKFNKDVLESFKQLAETDCVEFVGQTYYHSLSGLYREKNEFIEQVQKHKQVIRDFLGKNPLVFENTELLYNNAIAETVEKLGYLGIVIEGVERILGGQSPNYVYLTKNCRKLKVLLRNYKLTDDIGFRFSARWWSEWPLTADKYASWLASTQGRCIVIFPDYETFGEHHWPETGIQDFLYHLLKELTSRNGLTMATPSEVVQKNEPIGVIDVPELEGTISWADIRRDSSCWIGNTMQWAYYKAIRDLEPLIKESLDPELTKLWRYFQISDHLYYMYTGGGGPSNSISKAKPLA